MSQTEETELSLSQLSRDKRLLTAIFADPWRVRWCRRCWRASRAIHRRVAAFANWFNARLPSAVSLPIAIGCIIVETPVVLPLCIAAWYLDKDVAWDLMEEATR